MSITIAVLSLIQETNTFSAKNATYEDFKMQGIWYGQEADLKSSGSNTEIAGAISYLRSQSCEVIPIMRAWAMSGGVLGDEDFRALLQPALEMIVALPVLDGVILNLHGALITQTHDYADAEIVARVRALIGEEIPIAVTHDLHANVTSEIMEQTDILIGYQTYPHIDQAETGAKAAQLLLDLLTGGAPIQSVISKIPLLIPAEVQIIKSEPMLQIRDLADSYLSDRVMDISLFPVQPWIDVPKLGFAVTVTGTLAKPELLKIATEISDKIWEIKEQFEVDLVKPADAITRIRKGNEAGRSKFSILLQSSDAPPGGAAGDNAALIGELIKAGPDFNVYTNVVDVNAVADANDAGVGGEVKLSIGAAIDPRWSDGVLIFGKVLKLGSTPILLKGIVMNGQEVSIGNWATIDCGRGLIILVSTEPAPSFDPATYESVGLAVEKADAVHVRSCALFRASYVDLFDEVLILDIPGPTSPALAKLDYQRAQRPLFPLDR
ncbi:MAG: M81 family peptidase [Candidatus Nanopelagicaceae bacterium]|nr:M81 family peptidase [Candidatus Nanopelagicaceae bacterium]